MVDSKLRAERGSLRSLGPRATHEWRQLSAQVMAARGERAGLGTNAKLLSAADREPQSPASPAFRLWAAQNFSGAGAYAEAVRAYDDVIKSAGEAAPLLDVLDFTRAALRHKAGSAMLIGDAATASDAWRALLAHDPTVAEAGLQAGLIAEAAGQEGDAALLYRAVAAAKPSRRTEDDRELARRALLRLKSPRKAFKPTAQHVADALADAFARRDAKRLSALASPTHFAIGPAGGHDAFERDGLPDYFFRDLAESAVTCDAEVGGFGETRYITSRGWNGPLLRGDIYLTITQSPGGWQWTGVLLTAPTLAWIDHWREPTVARRESGSFGYDLLAPWPAGQCFRAGGATNPIYLLKLEAIRLLGPVGILLFAQFSSGGGCGWGIPGFYYDTPPTHQNEDEFAIDFVRHDRDVPFDNVSGGTPVLAARDGVVGEVLASAPTGSRRLNRTHIYHEDPENSNDETRYMTRYLHLDGPFVDCVCDGMDIYAGNRLGRMDSTGKPPNFMKHLHFSIHDREVPHPNERYGASIRPSPLSGTSLDDSLSDNGKCICSDNVELVGIRPMIEPSSYPVSNWIITPAGPSATEQTPPNVADQRFLLILSGVAVVEFKGQSPNNWLTSTVVIRPDLTAPILHACDVHGIMLPRENTEPLYNVDFEVEQYALSGALASIYNDNVSNDSGFALNEWRQGPYRWGRDAFTNVLYERIFTGAHFDIAARDSDAYIKRLSYHISLLGRIAFTAKIPET